MINSYDLQNEVSNDSKFYKTVPITLQEVRKALGDGLFTVSRRMAIFLRLAKANQDIHPYGRHTKENITGGLHVSGRLERMWVD